MSASKSTDKLEVVCEMVKDLPPAKQDKIKFFRVNWKCLNDFNGDSMYVPDVELEFFQ